MSRRIEVELTSARPDGTWTWRAAGAREPRGELDGAVLPASAKVGDVLRVDAEFEIDGITIINVLPPKGTRKEPERLELVGGEQPFEAVITTLAERKGRSGDTRERRDRPDRGDRPRRDGGGPGGPRGDRTGGPGGAGGGDRPRGPRPDRPAGAGGGPGDRARREGAGREGGGSDRPRRSGPPPASKPDVPAKPKPKRLRPGRAHRNEVLASLPEEQRAVAEQVLRGGIPAVRAAVEEQNATLKAEGKPEIRPGGVVALAEELLPRLRLAEWLDRAEAALADAAEIDLRDLRSVVSAANDVAREESARDLAAQLRDALAGRVDAEHTAWLAEISGALTEGRSVRALRLSSRPPKAGARFPAEVAGPLAAAAAASLTPEASAERWIAVLDALAFSPVRTFVVPAGVPTTVPADLTEAVTRLAGTLPEIAKMFGIEPPEGGRPGGRRPGGPRRPPRPAKPAKPAEPAAADASPADADPAGAATGDAPASEQAPDAATASDATTGSDETTEVAETLEAVGPDTVATDVPDPAASIVEEGSTADASPAAATEEPPGEATGSTEPTEPTEPQPDPAEALVVEPTEPAPTEPQPDPAEALVVEPTEPTEPTEPAEPAEPIEPAEPTGSTEPEER